MRTFTLLFFTLFSFTLLSSCGFKLKQYEAIDTSLQALNLESHATAAQFSYQLKNELAKRGVRVSALADNTLSINNYQITQQAASISSANARQTETRLTSTVSYSLRDTDGTILIPDTTLSRSKEYINDNTNISGKMDEERLLRAELDLELIERIIRQLENTNSNVNLNNDSQSEEEIAPPSVSKNELDAKENKNGTATRTP